MASDEVGVELGVDTVEKCKAALKEAEELQVPFFFCVFVGTSHLVFQGVRLLLPFKIPALQPTLFHLQTWTTVWKV